ncbi:hypothetical protein K466DRAFT_579849 [Polyporus arcularius HHB13444]|uniref:SAP domain-containing protein n=1 Tax=Polyporus arcularius HHB13444 TaxID=1314778 RepID=A0A5C3Q0G9_9APHY|nr:hypothetical protein K466DRAFT_579849 [Polyporus arcularius HHB13444]
MDSKLKSLKVVDLKDILAKANVAITGKANKQDLIAKILASPEAVDVYNKSHGPTPPLTSQSASAAPESPPETSEASPKASAPSSTAAPASKKPPSHAAPKAAPAPSSPAKSEQPSADGDAVTTPEDAEAAKRRARAERFGIPLVEPKTAPAQTKKGRPATNGKAAKATMPDDPEKLAARQARFGLQDQPQAPTGKTNGKKRSAPVEESVDAEELERRKKRAERFGTAK